jgi:sortase A
MNETTLPGKDGNCVLAAHRSFTYGRFFNRLDEVFIGDRVNIETKNGMYRYTIFEKKRVLPNDTSVLDSKKGKKYLTLITCDPMKNPTHRLILVGKL